MEQNAPEETKANIRQSNNQEEGASATQSKEQDADVINVKEKTKKILFVSRIVFPSCFALFNLIYWSVYLS